MPFRVRGSAIGASGSLLLVLAACATPQTRLAPVPKEAVKAEEEKQRELAIEDNQEQQERLDSLGFPILRHGTELCTQDLGTRLSARFTNIYQYEPLWRPAAAKVLGVGDTLTVIGVTPEGAAQNAGLRKGDHVLAVGGQSIEVGATALKDFSAKVSEAKKADASRLNLTVGTPEGRREVPVALDRVCDYDNIVLQGDELNAFSDGVNIVMTSTMMRFANDQELQVVYAHEFAHNAMHHIQAKKKNSLFGALIGALGDIAMAAQGINTGGYYTAKGAKAGAMSFSQDFEREADYVGLYSMALADMSLTSAPNFWRHMAKADPKSIGLAYTHPTTAERFVRMEQAIREIDQKLAEHVALRPEMKNSKQSAPLEPETSYALREAGSAHATRPDSTAKVPAQAGRAARLSVPPQPGTALVDSNRGYVSYAQAATGQTAAAGPATAPPSDSTAVSGHASAGPLEAATMPAVGYTRLPEGTNLVGDARIKRFYPIGCAAQHAIPPDQQVFFQSSEGAERDGFIRSGDC